MKSKKTPALPGLFCLSGKRDSNSRPSAWEADALPTELFPPVIKSFFQLGIRQLADYQLSYSRLYFFMACGQSSVSSLKAFGVLTVLDCRLPTVA